LLRTPPDADVTIAETFFTERREADDIDSPTVWHGPGGRHWLISTAKSAHQLLVHDATNGKLIRRVGGPGTEAGQFQRPNGIVVIGDFVIVVERDNHRLQALSLPDLEPVALIGAEVLRQPYGIDAAHGEGGWDVWVTDSYEPKSSSAPATEMGERLRRFRLQVSETQLTGEYVGAFGDTTEDGYLRKVESVAMDPLLGRMLVADESEGVIKVYDLEGRFTGQLVGDGVFYRQPEGVALLECAEGRGYWFATDQDYVKNRFLIFDRENLAIQGTFSGAVTINTDGVALTGRSFGPFTRGAFYAVHDDGNVAAFDMAEIIAAFGLDCGPR
jgi:3-phytase